ncbi:transcriptional regulator [Halococcus sp. AFM35]|uniref:HVO_A0114 family putative DNA-binding protein n=1 Tax=Halococcus sp. AFM35 TaxID=3421653 RepID=UPI003EC02F47
MTEPESDSGRSETERILEIRVQDFDSFTAASTAALEEAVTTREGESSVLAFETPRQALRLLSDARFVLLEAIRAEKPESIRELARLVERDVSVVHSDLELLADHGIVEFHQEGRNKRPTVAYEEIRINVDLSFDSGTDSETLAHP